MPAWRSCGQETLQLPFTAAWAFPTRPEETVVTVGGSEAIDMCIRALVNPGDEVIIPEPCFVCYYPIATLTGGVPVPLPLKARERL